MADLGAAANDTTELEQEIGRLDAIAEGKIAGIISTQYLKEAIDQLESRISSADGDAKKLPSVGGTIGKLAYTYAAHRDANYGCRGRKFMRIAGMTQRSRDVFGRIVGISSADIYKLRKA